MSVRSIASELKRSLSIILRKLNVDNALYFKEYTWSQIYLRIINSWQETHSRINYFLKQKVYMFKELGVAIA